MNQLIQYQALQRKTSPLPLQTVRYICSNLNLEQQLCSREEAIYAHDLFPVVREELLSGGYTYDSVNAKLRPFLIYCDPDESENGQVIYIFCDYDLRGDRITWITVAFYGDGRVWRAFYELVD
jgi:hypothetical protein